jgi:hypothetical protein
VLHVVSKVDMCGFYGTYSLVEIYFSEEYHDKRPETGMQFYLQMASGSE